APPAPARHQPPTPPPISASPAQHSRSGSSAQTAQLRCADAYWYGAYRRGSIPLVPSGAAENAKVPTPLSEVSPQEPTAFASSAARVSATSSQRSGHGLPC